MALDEPPIGRNELKEAIKKCRESVAKLEQEKTRMLQRLAAYEQLLKLEEGDPGAQHEGIYAQEAVVVPAQSPVALEVKESVAGAAIAYLSEHGGKAHGRDILKALQAKGHLLNSKSPSSHLTNALKKNKRIKRDLSARNTWMLVEQ